MRYPCVHASSSGSILGSYEIVAPLGSGGMGEVYRARDSRIGREVALKILPASFLENEERRRRFEQEARAAGAINHPNLLVIHDVGTSEGIPFIVSELLEGETLRGRMASPLPQKKALAYALQVASGLAAAHDRGVIHRDLKPENIFVSVDDHVKLLDFGLAKLLETGREERATSVTMVKETNPGVVVGTPAYMSPEQARADAIDARSDIFSLGVVLAEMLSRQHPFLRKTAIETMSAILSDDPRLGEMSSAAARTLEHMLEKSPHGRFQSMRDV